MLLISAAVPLLLGRPRCGGDDDDDDAGAFCAAEIDSRPPSAPRTRKRSAGVRSRRRRRPEDVAEAVDTAIAEAQRFLAEDSEPTPEFETAYAEMMTFMKEECGFTDLAVTSTEYSFGGLPDEVDAGPAVITIENDGQEFHEIALMRINDDVTESAEELLALPQEEAESKLQTVAGGFAAARRHRLPAADLTPGRYVAICFVPWA